jgi:hypothetical protein
LGVCADFVGAFWTGAFPAGLALNGFAGSLACGSRWKRHPITFACLRTPPRQGYPLHICYAAGILNARSYTNSQTLGRQWGCRFYKESRHVTQLGLAPGECLQLIPSFRKPPSIQHCHQTACGPQKIEAPLTVGGVDFYWKPTL